MPDRIYKGDPIADAWSLFRRTYDSIARCEEATFAKVGMLPQQYQVLCAIGSIKGTVTPTLVANFLDRRPNSMSLIIDRMEKGGLVERIRDLKDRRTVRIIITPEGNKRCEQVHEAATELPKEILLVLTEEELSTFTRLLRNIRERTFELRNIKDKVSDIDLNV